MSHPLRVVLSVLGWWALVVLPGVLTLTGVFGDVGPETEMGGAIVAVWIVCYLAQLAMIFVVTRAVGHTSVWWFFVASLLPWVVDWGTPYAFGVGLVTISVAALVAELIVWLSLRTIRLDEHGRQVTATVVKVLKNHMNVVINNVYIRRRVLLDIPGADGAAPYQAVLPMLCEIGTSPSTGDRLRLRVDPGNPKHFALDPSNRDQD